MDKNMLNNEVVLCRGAVRKAKVAVIRKILRKMKILKGCKIESLKEKKLKKVERLFKKVQMMKRVKVDEVTKFGLRNKHLDPFLKGAKLDLRENALASLAAHEAVAKKINSIRERIPNWETELPFLLDSLGKKKRKKDKPPTSGANEEDTKKRKVEASDKMKQNGESKKEKRSKSGGMTRARKESVSEESNDGRQVEKAEEITKIDDPFFIGKNIIAPKFVLDNLTREKPRGKLKKPQPMRNEFQGKLFKTKRDDKVQVRETEGEKLHPSWAAKKAKLIKPFQGKKITFSDD